MHRAALTRLKSQGGACGDIKAMAMGGCAVKIERGVGLGEVVVAADLHGAVAGDRFDAKAVIASDDQVPFDKFQVAI